jgi:hypothetical protein
MTKKEIWLVYYTKGSGQQRITYLDAVEEALCFGWIDGIAKKFDAARSAQRFTPRRPKSNWTELNKERMRRLIAEGKMTAAGLAVAPNLAPEAFSVAPDILAALQSDAQTWHNYQQFPDLYKRIRVGFVEEVRRQPPVFQQRLAHFLKMTRENKMFGTLQ